ncbi:MAG: hypothetical protein EPN93_06135 [Spirochaetes bacterium]|nr:MAG: hypothetical protein EPN93_06135 [Spirochaetota bacterium]
MDEPGLDAWTRAYLLYDLAVMKRGEPHAYGENLQAAKSALESDARMSTAFYAQVVEDLGKATMGRGGEALLREAAARRAMLNISSEGGPELTYVPMFTDYYTSAYMNYFFSLYNRKYQYDFTNLSLTCRGRVTPGEMQFFATYYPGFMKSIRELEEKTNLAYFERVDAFLFPRSAGGDYRDSAFNSIEEEKLLQFVVEKYQYSFYNSPQIIKARTVEGRLIDCNLFLSAAINHRSARELPTMPRMLALNIFNWNELQGIDTYCRDKNAELSRAIGINLYDYYNAGKIVFVDVGPALANERTSAVTTLELSSDFPNIRCVALDLPEQVSIFNSPAFYNENKAKILSSPNIYILPGDGTKSISNQLFMAKTGENRALPLADDELIILRCANSLDVYVSWEKNREYLEKSAREFRGNPLLVFHNKVVIFKPRGAVKYRFVGLLSDAGFDHLRDAIIHNGAMPFTLFPQASGM